MCDADIFIMLLSYLENLLKELRALKIDNQRLRDENGSLKSDSEAL